MFKELFEDKQFIVALVFLGMLVAYSWVYRKFKLKDKFYISNKYLRILMNIITILIIIIVFEYFMFIYDENPEKT